MNTLSDITGLRASARHECPICGSSDGLSIDDDGPKGVYHCFSCNAGGDGIELLRAYGWTFQAAADALGYEAPSTPLALEVVKRDREQRQRLLTAKDRIRSRCLEVVKTKRAMTDDEREWWRTIGSLPRRCADASLAAWICDRFESTIRRRDDE